MTLYLLHESGVRLLCAGDNPFDLSIALKCTLPRVGLPLRAKTELLNGVNHLFSLQDEVEDTGLVAQQVLPTQNWFINLDMENTDRVFAV